MEIQIYDPPIMHLDAFDNELKIGDRVILSHNNKFYKAHVDHFTDSKVAVCGCFDEGSLQLLFKLSDKLVRI